MAAAVYTRSTFLKYSKLRSRNGLSGAEAARRLLAHQGIRNVIIEPASGFLTDHYEPSNRTLRLSPEVHNSMSLSAIGVACHEAGHALQHARSFLPLVARSALVPAAQFGSYGAPILLLVGALLNSMLFVKLGIWAFSFAVLFYLITLPVEWHASMRAKQLMVTSGVVSADEATIAGRVLNAAFLTYVAAALTALLQLLYYLWRFGLVGGRRS